MAGKFCQFPFVSSSPKTQSLQPSTSVTGIQCVEQISNFKVFYKITADIAIGKKVFQHSELQTCKQYMMCDQPERRGASEVVQIDARGEDRLDLSE